MAIPNVIAEMVLAGKAKIEHHTTGTQETLIKARSDSYVILLGFTCFGFSDWDQPEGLATPQEVNQNSVHLVEFNSRKHNVPFLIQADISPCGFNNSAAVGNDELIGVPNGKVQESSFTIFPENEDVWIVVTKLPQPASWASAIGAPDDRNIKGSFGYIEPIIESITGLGPAGLVGYNPQQEYGPPGGAGINLQKNLRVIPDVAAGTAVNAPEISPTAFYSQKSYPLINATFARIQGTAPKHTG